MPVKVLMPQLGESVDEATVSKWLKARGDTINEFEPLLEINTEKVDSEIISPAAGVVLDILVNAGTTVHSGTLLAWIGEPGETTAAEPAAAASADIATPAGAPQGLEVVSEAKIQAGRREELGFISPLVSKMASEHGIDLNQVRGTGAGGRITKKDVQAFLEEKKAQGSHIPGAILERQVVESKPPEPVIPGAGALPASRAPAAVSAGSGGEIVPLTAVRRAIAEHMVLSKHTSPHVTTVMEADFSWVAAHRTANKEAYARDGANLTFTAYLIAAIAAALKAYPMVNASWSEQGILLHRQVNIGMATSLGEDGLIVPVIKNADGYSLLGLARAINDLANRARARKLQPDEVKGGTFTLTNHGTTGSLFATPIINQPQCAILGSGAIQKRVVVLSDANNGDTIAIRPMAYLTLTFDHRILDGAMGDNFLGKVVETLQNWG
jgi:2-oxoglutarate dehydrogenase E2 component (dihydrolipoamide succinyltransferase)